MSERLTLFFCSLISLPSLLSLLRVCYHAQPNCSSVQFGFSLILASFVPSWRPVREHPHPSVVGPPFLPRSTARSTPLHVYLEIKITMQTGRPSTRSYKKKIDPNNNAMKFVGSLFRALFCRALRSSTLKWPGQEYGACHGEPTLPRQMVMRPHRQPRATQTKYKTHYRRQTRNNKTCGRKVDGADKR